LAYWEHELGRGEAEPFTLKQIRLQTWSGHQGSVRSLAALDNENSFLSGGKDRTVRIWSLRNSGEGDHIGGPQWIYTGHRKSVFSVGYLSPRGLAASCDGVIHVWDPFVGTTVREIEAGRGGSYCVMNPQRFSYCIVAANSEGNIAVIDTRSPAPAVELRVSVSVVGLIRSLCCAPNGGQAAVGHSSGYISLVDLRTGKLRTGIKAHEGEVLTLTSGDSYYVSTSLDQTATGESAESLGFTDF
jgi:WD repeat-containing protein 81